MSTQDKANEALARLFFAAIATEVPDELPEEVKARGGITLHSDSLEPYAPSNGYFVALKAPGVVLDNADLLTAFAMEVYLRKNKSYFEEDRNFFGIWIDDEDGKVYLDVSVWVQDRQEAIDLGLMEDQISIWDIENQEAIYL